MTTEAKTPKGAIPSSELSEPSEESPVNGQVHDPEPVTIPVEDASWFASTDTRTLQLGGGRWVEIKEELTYREAADIDSAGLRARSSNGAEPDFWSDLGEMGMTKLKMWLTDWNLKDRRGEPIPCTAAGIESLTRAGADAILVAIRAHEATLEARPNSPSAGGTKS